MGGTRHGRPVRGARTCHEHVALMTRLVDEACNNGNLAVLDEALALPAGLAMGGATAGQRLTWFLSEFRAAVPNAHWTIEEQIAAGATVVTRLSVRGAFSGPLVGLAPPGRPATVTGIAISRFAGGCIVDLWLQADLLGLLQQLGVMPQLDLTRTVALAQVIQAGALLAGEPEPRHPVVGRRADRDGRSA